MKTIIIHHVDENFETEVVETIVMAGGRVRNISYGERKKI
jgi:hypothetical protein